MRNNHRKTRHSYSALIPAFTAGVMAMGTITAHASSDYGPAIWRPAYSGHWYTSGNGHKFHVEHDMEGYYASTIPYLQQSGTTVSIHYCVNGKKDASSDYAAGEITQMVLEAYYAWHAKCWNTHSLGTEHEGFRSNPAWFTEELYQASGGITKHTAEKFGFAKDRNHIVGHDAKSSSAWVSWANANLGINASCNSHDDPGPYWDWNHYMQIVNPPNPPAPLSLPQIFDAGVNANGAMTILFRGSDNALWERRQSGPNSGDWSGETRLGGYVAGCPKLARNIDGSLQVFFRGADGALWYRVQNGPNGAWGPEVSLGGYLTSPAIVGIGASGVLEPFYRGSDNALWHRWQEPPGSQSWTAEDRMGGFLTSTPGWARNLDGRQEIWYRGYDSALWHRWQLAPNGAWSGEERLVGYLTSSPVIGINADGRQEIWYRGSDNALWHRWQLAPNGGWSGEENLHGYLTSAVTVGYQADGRQEVFYRGSDNGMWSRVQTAPNSGWAPETQWGGYLTSAPVTSRNADGRIQVFYRGYDNAFWTRSQATPNGGWNAEQRIGGWIGDPEVN